MSKKVKKQVLSRMELLKYVIITGSMNKDEEIMLSIINSVILELKK